MRNFHGRGVGVVTENGDSQTADRTLGGGGKGVKSGGMETWSSLEWLVAWMGLGTLDALLGRGF